MYFSAHIFSKYYKLLGTQQQEGKTNLERTSILLYFLAIDRIQKENDIDVIDVNKDSVLRRKFMDSVTEISVFYTKDEKEYQANYLGEVNHDNNKMAVKAGKNFLSTQVNHAEKVNDPVDYPTRPKDSAILKLGYDTNNGKTGIKKHYNWKEHIMTFINFRFCGDDTFPLIVFLLRDVDFDIEKNFEENVTEEIYKEYTEELADFLIHNANIPSLDYIKNFSQSKWKLTDLDNDLFKIKDLTKKQSMKPLTDPYTKLSINENVPRNRIIYGAPGTGKSYLLNEEIDSYFGDERLCERITFYPNFSYSKFIGSYKPVSLYKETEKKIYSTDKRELLETQVEPIIDYQFVPGPFIKNLVRAYKNPESSFVLVIEEINRANAPAVFGDVFQLLDRNSNGESEYAITFNPDIMNYLRTQGFDDTQFKLPQNFFIWTTMNSADQGVFAMDTAFKRRWSFEYLPLNENENVMDNYNIMLPFMNGEEVPWNRFRNLINEYIKDYVSEDKLIGPFFLKPHEINNPELLKNKLILYLRDDVLRYNYDKLFLKKTFSDILKDYDNGKNIFVFSEDELRSVI